MEWKTETKPCLSRRDMFAMAAMQGILASGDREQLETKEILAKCSRLWADALIAELDKKSEASYE
jgi:hypothetical protein